MWNAIETPGNEVVSESSRHKKKKMSNMSCDTFCIYVLTTSIAGASEEDRPGHESKIID